MSPARRDGSPARRGYPVGQGSVVYLHGVGGVRERWRPPLARVVGQRPVVLLAPAYDDLLTTSGRVHASPAAPLPEASQEADRVAYLERQRRLVALVEDMGESSRGAWPAGLPHPAEIADRLPLRAVLRTPLLGLDQVGRYLDDAARRAAVLSRVVAALLRAPRPRVVVAHSLGSLVAWDALSDPRVDIDLLVTLGSPLASPALGASQRDFPYRRVGAWLNVVHLLDPVPAGRGLGAIYPAACDAFLSPVPKGAPGDHPLVRAAATLARAATSHLESTYLESRTVLAAVDDALARSASHHPGKVEARAS